MKSKGRALVISVLNQKGGVGKTTISTNLVYGLNLKGYATLLADGDPQKTARKWHEANDARLVPCAGLDQRTLPTDLKIYSSNYDVIVIDGAPGITELASIAVRVSDVILIPVHPADFDIWSTAGLIDLIKQRQDITEGFPLCSFIISRQIRNTNLSREIRPSLEKFEIPILDALTTQRVSYIEHGNRGETVFSDPKSPAALEFEALVDEVIFKYVNI